VLRQGCSHTERLRIAGAIARPLALDRMALAALPERFDSARGAPDAHPAGRRSLERLATIRAARCRA